MEEKNIILIGRNINDMEQSLQQFIWNNDLDCEELERSGCKFCLLSNEAMTRIILYCRRDYFENNGKLYYIDLHAVKIYSSPEECYENLNGDICYFVHGEKPEEMEV